MTFFRYKRISLLFLLTCFTDVHTAYSQDSMSELSRALEIANTEKARIAEADIAANGFVSRYTQLMNDFEKNSKKFQVSRQLFEAELKTRQEGIAELSQYINNKVAIVTSHTAKPSEINEVWDGFAKIRQRKNPCDDIKTLHNFRETLRLAGLLHSQRVMLSALPGAYTLVPEHKPLIDSARQGIALVDTTMQQVDAIVSSYQGALETPDVCNIFRNFDVIVSLAAVAAETNQAAAELDKVDINGFLAEIDSANAATKAVTTARRMLTSLEATLIRFIRAGYLNKSVAYEDRYVDALNAISSNILNSPSIASMDKSDISAKVKQVRTSIELELKNARLNEMDGRRALLLTRGRNLYAAASRIHKEIAGITSPDQAKKSIIEYCKANLGMSFSGRYLVPATKTIDEQAELDRKFETADKMISALSGSRS